MEKSLVSANELSAGANDRKTLEGEFKYICESPSHSFMLPVLDSNGKLEYETDAYGNNRRPKTIMYNFTSVSGHKNSDGKVDANTAFCFFVVNKGELGEYYERILELLEKECKNPLYKMYREDDHFKKRNPEAFKIASEKRETEKLLVQKNKEIEDLRAQLFKKKG